VRRAGVAAGTGRTGQEMEGEWERETDRRRAEASRRCVNATDWLARSSQVGLGWVPRGCDVSTGWLLGQPSVWVWRHVGWSQGHDGAGKDTETSACSPPPCRTDGVISLPMRIGYVSRFFKASSS
jgi:hypothetical protein